MKKIINNSNDVVKEMLEGMSLVHAEYIKKVDNFNILVRSQTKKQGVCLVSGGGSGHEPAHGGYVGYGMLDAAVIGEVFTSPTPDQVYQAIKSVDNGDGVLLIIKNYSGDIMNFEMGEELAKEEGIKVEKVIVADDIAVENSTWSIGRRGIAGTIFVHKIAGALAEKKATLQEVKKVAQKTVDNLASIGMAIKPCIIPAAKKPSFELLENEMEIGIGIHGEPGINREELKKADEITDILIEKILAEKKYPPETKVAMLINGLGSTPLMEQYIIARKAFLKLTKENIKVSHTFVGNYMTSLEMAGFSITLLKLDDELEKLLLAPSDTLNFKK